MIADMSKKLFRDKICLLITTLFGVGYVPLLPGTTASVGAVVFFLLIKDPITFAIFTFFSLLLAFSLSSRAEYLLKEKDSKKIVIDDFSGMLISLLFIPHRTILIVIGFFLFRFFDMIKVPPANKLEELPGARGIVGDDFIAGLYANIVLQIARFLF